MEKQSIETIRVAWFSPLSPTTALRSAIASNELLPHLASEAHGVRFEIELFVDSREWHVLDRAQFPFPIHHYLHACIRHAEKPFDIFLYHWENHPECLFVLHSLALMPGVVVLHQGELSTTKQSPAVVVCSESEHAQLIAKQRQYGKSFSVLPLPVRPLAEAERALGMSLRKTLSLAEGTPLVGMCGNALFEERITTSLAVLNGVLERSPETPLQVLWIVANPEAHQDARVRFAAFCEEFPQLQGRLSLHCIASYDELRVAVGALDLFLGLSFSLFREAPLALLLSLRFGVPSISSEFGAVREIPLTVVPQVTVGRDESGVATLLLERLLSDPRLRQELSHTSIEYAELVHSPHMGAEDLRQVIMSHRSALRAAVADQTQAYAVQRSRLIEEYGVFNWGAQEYTVQQANRTQP